MIQILFVSSQFIIYVCVIDIQSNNDFVMVTKTKLLTFRTPQGVSSSNCCEKGVDQLADAAKLKNYKIADRKDAFGLLDKNSSL